MEMMRFLYVINDYFENDYYLETDNYQENVEEELVGSQGEN